MTKFQPCAVRCDSHCHRWLCALKLKLNKTEIFVTQLDSPHSKCSRVMWLVATVLEIEYKMFPSLQKISLDTAAQEANNVSPSLAWHLQNCCPSLGVSTLMAFFSEIFSAFCLILSTGRKPRAEVLTGSGLQGNEWLTFYPL